MLEEQRLEKQDQLKQLVLRISKIETGLLYEDDTVAVATEFKEIYKGRFRHQYSDLFPIIRQILEEFELYDKDILLENLRSVRECVEQEHGATGQFDALYLPLLKLMDHINLELARLSVFSIDERRLAQINADVNDAKEGLRETEGKLSEAIELLAQENKEKIELQADLEEATKNLKDANEKAKNLQTELVSVLSIFAGVVIAFFGGLSFLGSSISSIQNVIIYKSVLVCVLCGLVLFNLIFLLLYIVGKIINRSIFARCSNDCKNDSTCKCTSGCSSPCSGFKRLRKRLPYVFWVNATGLLICLVDVIAWYLRIRSFFPFNF